MAESTVKLQGPTNITSMSVGGETFDVMDGVVVVPAEFERELASHGFVRWQAPPGASPPMAAPAPAPAATPSRKPPIDRT